MDVIYLIGLLIVSAIVVLVVVYLMKGGRT